jgi:hypothetical protein
MIAAQANAYIALQRVCPSCGTSYTYKGQHTIVVPTLFGTVRVPSLRFYVCRCEPQSTASWSPLAERLPERTMPELLYLQAKFAALMSYGLTVDLLADVVPLDQELNVATVFRDVQQVAERLEEDLGEERPMFIEGCLRDWEQPLDPEGPLTVGLDGGSVHAREAPSRHEGWFEVIVGKSVPTDSPAKCFGFVQSYDTKPKRRLFEVLASQGRQADRQLTFLSDGGDTVRNLPQYLRPQAEHIRLESRVLAYIVNELQKYSLLQTDTDVKGEAYEEIVGANLRGDRGEFFTARNVCKMAVEMVLATYPKDRWLRLAILDPACGTGGFLVAAMNLPAGAGSNTGRRRGCCSSCGGPF